MEILLTKVYPSNVSIIIIYQAITRTKSTKFFMFFLQHFASRMLEETLIAIAWYLKWTINCPGLNYVPSFGEQNYYKRPGLVKYPKKYLVFDKFLKGIWK